MFGKPNNEKFVEAVKLYKTLETKLRNGEQEPVLVGLHYTVTKHGVYLLQRREKSKLSFFTKEIVKDKVQVERWRRWKNKQPQNRYKKTKVVMWGLETEEKTKFRYKTFKTKVNEPYLPKRFLLKEDGQIKVDRIYSAVERLHHLTQRPIKEVNIESMERFNEFKKVCGILETHCTYIQTLHRESVLTAAYKQARAEDNKLKTYNLSSHEALVTVDPNVVVIDAGAALKESLRESRGN